MRVDFQTVPYDLDCGSDRLIRVGLISLASDHTIEEEFRMLLNVPGVSFYTTRICNAPTIAPETLAAMEDRIAEQAGAILPGLDIDVIAYGCTSATTVLGEETVFARLREGKPGIRPTTPLSGADAALKTFGASRIAVVTPYAQTVNEIMVKAFKDRGYHITRFLTFNTDDDNVAGRISAESIQKAALDAGSDAQADAVFISCTNLRIASAIPEIEVQLGKPVTSSNHAMAWHCLRLAGVETRIDAKGHLFTLPLSG